jgi:hypothetical protein
MAWQFCGQEAADSYGPQAFAANGPRSQFPAPVERFLLADDMGRHRRTPARLRL